MAPQIHLRFVVLIFFCCCNVLVQSQVPESQTFQLINQGELVKAASEYGSTFRVAKPYEDSHKYITHTFGLYFYNATRNAYVLGIGGGHNVGGDVQWIWDANRNDPVQENATLTFGTDGNLVLADVDGRIVWQTNTANEGVAAISMGINGNLVLGNIKGKAIWQSFHHPTDTLAVCQSLKLKGNTKLVSRTSDRNSRDGPYSVILDDKNGFIMYQNTSGKLVQYAGWEAKGLSNVSFHAITRIDPVQPPQGPRFPDWEPKGKTFYFLSLGFAEGIQASTPSKRYILKTTDNSHLQHWSFLRLEADGNLVAYSYIIPSRQPYSGHWRKTYAFFGDTVKECALRSKCGSSGKCYGRLCSACPRNGSLGCMITV
ncbi:EP1-like glycoprotein 2 [Papaver somniferum]|uniref:EP1-like glycoprotein 2 n=1 Tax=Papaver somniferum TaxID=3469 RepID=UPI000E6FEA70|nr:EP1-like glycoprotein 2 [Papaver somniferum]